ncbi:MAG: RecQ family ATP-dependent DNA helicase [Spirochaetia bacterium]
MNASPQGPSAVDSLVETARARMGVSYLYPLQRFVISNTLDGKSQIVVLPTGAGKSLCFQLPALLLGGPTLVLVPLLSLMADQLRKLQETGVAAAVLRGGLSRQEKADLFQRIREGKAPLVFATPEACLVESNLWQLRSCAFRHLVIDEAHCVSQWGDSFRPAYREVGALARRLAIPVRTAFTATASQAVIDRIKDLVFGDGDVRVLAAAPDRPNIFYAVSPVLSLSHALEEIARGAPRPVLAFFRTRNETEIAARTVRRRLGDEQVRFYHAGLSREERGDVEEWYLASANGALFATCAYGMGVDKPDIRTVVHVGAPSSVEAYLQETGRAGRDGKPSRAVLLVSREDTAFVSGLPEGRDRQSYQRMLAYALSHGACRRQMLLDLIGAEPVACSGCDVCAGAESAAAAGEREILDFARRLPRRFAVAQAAEILAGARGPRPTRRFHDCVKGYGSLEGWAKEDVEAAIRELVIRGSLSVTRRGPWKHTLRA